MKRFLISLLISGVLIYFALRGVDWTAFKDSLAHIEYPYLLVVVPLLLLIQWIRSYRWGLILKPIKKIDQRTLFPITSVGFMGILLLPARTGELLRPYLISQQKGVDVRSALATVVVERILDSLTIIGFLVWIIFFIPVPLWVHQAGYLSFTLFFCLLLFLFFVATQKERTLNLSRILTRRFPKKLQSGVQTFITTFMEGLQVLPDLRNFGMGIGLSLMIWALMGLVFYILFHAFHMRLPLIAAYAVLVLIVIGITIPGAPGFVGNYHLFCVLGLSLFGIPRSEALSYAIVNHLVIVVFTVALGIIFLPKVNISWPNLFKKRESM